MSLGAQSILIKNLQSYQEDFNSKLLNIAEDFIIYKRFIIGEKMNFNEMMFTKSFHKLLCTDNCEIIDYIDKKIKGKLDEFDVKYKKKSTISDLLKKYEEEVKKCSNTEALVSCVGEIRW